MHTVDYRGIWDRKTIAGIWRLRSISGEFRIWPGASEEGEEEAARTEIEEPVEELVLV
jgi:hypothetical protein